MLTITSDFDSGNIVCKSAEDPSNIELEIKPDGKAAFFQWFFYCVEGGEGQNLVMRLTNADGASYQGGWKDYHAVASYDQEEWFRVASTSFDGRELTIRHAPEKDKVWYAYFAPYPTSRYRTYIENIKASSVLKDAVLGETLDGQEIHYFQAGSGPRQMWVIARQHPGETMGSWWMEGFIERLTDDTDEGAKALLEKATLHIVPCMNLDGVKRGHLRTNAAGKDLNRAWRNTTMEESPEVYLVREKMRETGVDFFLDVHGDEAIPNNFLDNAFGIPSWDERHEKLFATYSSRLLDISKDFQTKQGYPPAAPGKANLDIANSYVAETWNCLSMTLEMPFKDANVNPDPEHGWSPARCRNFAREHLTVMAEIADMLR
ncbi:M14 family metallopeptidase [Hyphococcus sp.]|uniref:M14 family metallopeptidase n=1 Tax=Hyphococcus sp. TaxID=2038636 RepID=UPI0035C6D2E9